MNVPIDLVVGFDQREAVAYHVFCQSVIDRASGPVRFLPLKNLGALGYTEHHKDGSNAFTYTRFLTPYLMGFKGWAIFMDGDMVCNTDIYELWKLRDPTKAVQVVKHDYKTKAYQKYLGNINQDYPRKNWSSVVLWNCEHPDNAQLTVHFVSAQSGAFLHRFQWLNDSAIGELPVSWNWLAIEYPSNPAVDLIHYTLGTPCFREYSETDFAPHWDLAFKRALSGLTTREGDD